MAAILTSSSLSNSKEHEEEAVASPTSTTTSTKKPVLACDIDEVLAYFIPALVCFHNDTFNTTLSAEDFVSYDFHLIWGGTVDDCNSKMDQFFQSDHFNNRISPIPAALESLRQLSQRFDLQVVTARQNKLKEPTIRWVDAHFPGIFSNIHFGNHYSTEGKKRSKSEMCLEIGAVALIDDSFSYAKDCAKAGIPVVLFGDYAWNRSHCVASLNEEKEMVVRVKDWNEAMRGIHQLLNLTPAVSSSSSFNSIATKKPILACDIDEVLAHFIPSLALFHNDQYDTNLTSDDFSSHEFHLIWGGTVEECNDKMELFYESDHFLSQLRPVQSALESLQSLREQFEIHVVTARHDRLKDTTTRWIETHYPGVFSDIHFGNHYLSEGKKKRSKSQMCLEIGAVALIDDSYTYAKDCASAGIPVVLFGDYPWNREHCIAQLNEPKEMVVRVRDWQEAIAGLQQVLRLQQ
jgi:uncharacterized HAD superfamily protein